MSRILIIGATGAVGGSLLRQLLALPSPPKIRISSRDPSKANFKIPSSSSSTVEIVQGDLTNPESYPALFKDIDRVFLYAGPTPPPAPLFQTAKEAGVQHIVFLSSYGITLLPDTIFAVHHLHWEDPILASGLKYTFLRPGSFASNTRAFWLPIVRALSPAGGPWKLPLPFPGSLAAPVSEEDIAAVALVALTTEELVNQAVDISGPVVVSHREQVEAINRLRAAEGKSGIELVALPAEEWKEAVSEVFPGPFPDSLVKWWGKCDGVPEQENGSEKYTGLPGESFDQWLERNKEAFLAF